MPEDETIEVELQSTLERLARAQRELSFHAMAAAGAEQGLSGCLTDVESDLLDEDAAAPELAMWARRVSSTHQAVAEVAHLVSIEANILMKFFEPTPDPESGH